MSDNRENKKPDGVSASVSSDKDQWLFEYAWKYFEIHVSHRTSMLNFLLIGAGLVATAYQSQGGTANASAIWIGFLAFASVASVAFFMLDVITLLKIQHAKHKMMEVLIDHRSGISDKFQAVLENEGETVNNPAKNRIVKFLRRDPLWTTFIEIALIFLFTTATRVQIRNWAGPTFDMNRAIELGKLLSPGLILALVAFIVACKTSLAKQTWPEHPKSKTE